MTKESTNARMTTSPSAGTLEPQSGWAGPARHHMPPRPTGFQVARRSPIPTNPVSVLRTISSVSV